MSPPPCIHGRTDSEPCVTCAYDRGYAAGLKAGQRKPWSARDIKILVDWSKSDAELAEHLGRTPLAIRMKRFKLRHEGE